jgi:hypothetical protein
VVVADEMLIERGQRRETPADRRRRGVLGLAHEAFPGDHRLVVGLAQRRRRGDRQRAHEVLDVEPVRSPGARALLLLQPDFFFGDRGEAIEGRPDLLHIDRLAQFAGFRSGRKRRAGGTDRHHGPEPPALTPVQRIERADRFFAATGADGPCQL